MTTVTDSDRSLGRAPSWLRALVTICGVEAGLALAYLLATDAGLAAPTSLAIPFVWLTAGGFAVWVVDHPSVTGWRRAVAVAVAVGYVAVLVWLTGTVSLSMGADTGLQVILLPPGWGPLLAWNGPVVSARLFPYRVFGHLVLGYLVFVAVTDVVRRSDGSEFDDGRACSVGGGLLALTSCAGCSLPLVSWILGSVGSLALVGSSGANAGFLTYVLATGAYLLAVVALTARRQIASLVR